MPARTKPESPFERTRGIELRYAMKLRKLAAKIGKAASQFSDLLTDGYQRFEFNRLMNEYAETITPWAREAAANVVREVDLSNARAYEEHSRMMSRALRRELERAPTGEMMRFMQAEQVQLIRSLPLEAAQRVQRIAHENLLNGERASQLAKEIMRTGEVTKSRATLIARTETSRTSSNLTMSRAIYVGSVEYVWETAHDSDVRPSHAKMQGRVVEWARPPTLDGLRGHAGCLPNCRCYPSPIIPM